jgi:ceramide glucosyltransferase
MWRHFEWALWAWTAAGVAWRLIALRLVGRDRRARRETPRTDGPAVRPHQDQMLSIFKPIPTRHDDSLFEAVESFVGQLDDQVELLLGVEERDAFRWKAFARHERVKLIAAPRPVQFLSPKVSWFHTLAAHATGEVWFWSDADMVLPLGGLDALRQEFASSGCSLLTTPYAVRRAAGAAVLEALFVNAEFYPGVLAAAGRLEFALGAGMMFRAEDFRRRVKWEMLGCRIADDNLLGRLLSPVKVSDSTLETLPTNARWGDAVLHYSRWQKTVLWCRPLGFAALLLILPVLGWAAAGNWAMTVVMVQVEAFTGWLLCRRVGCRLRNMAALEFWAVLRPLAWLACWLPWPVVFRSQKRIWWGLYRSRPMGEKT